MTLFLEIRKQRRTGFFPAFAVGGAAGAAIPVANMAFRSRIYTDRLTAAGALSPLKILLDANWLMMVMVNLLLVVSGACILYHTEFADNAFRKLCTLPEREWKDFLGKWLLLAAVSFLMTAMEGAALEFCRGYWFTGRAAADGADLAQRIRRCMEAVFGAMAFPHTDLVRSMMYGWLMMLPAVTASLLIASVCRNMWISLGIGVVCLAFASMAPADSGVLALFPYTLAFRIPQGEAVAEMAAAEAAVGAVKAGMAAEIAAAETTALEIADGAAGMATAVTAEAAAAAGKIVADTVMFMAALVETAALLAAGILAGKIRRKMA